MTKKEQDALEMISEYRCEGIHHSMWLLDQVARILAGDKYGSWRYDACCGPEGDPDVYGYDEGIAP